jgi:hypothetical protein
LPGEDVEDAWDVWEALARGWSFPAAAFVSFLSDVRLVPLLFFPLELFLGATLLPDCCLGREVPADCFDDVPADFLAGVPDVFVALLAEAFGAAFLDPDFVGVPPFLAAPEDLLLALLLVLVVAICSSVLSADEAIL